MKIKNLFFILILLLLASCSRSTGSFSDSYMQKNNIDLVDLTSGKVDYTENLDYNITKDSMIDYLSKSKRYVDKASEFFFFYPEGWNLKTYSNEIVLKNSFGASFIVRMFSKQVYSDFEGIVEDYSSLYNVSEANVSIKDDHFSDKDAKRISFSKSNFELEVFIINLDNVWFVVEKIVPMDYVSIINPAYNKLLNSLFIPR